MGDSTIAQLPKATFVNAGDYVPVDQGGVTRAITAGQLAVLAMAGQGITPDVTGFHITAGGKTAAFVNSLWFSGTDGAQVALGAGGTVAYTTGTVAAAGTATTLAGGAAGVVPYQAGTNTTAFTTAGTARQVFVSNGASAPSWLSQSGLAAGSATALAAGAAGQIPYQIGTGTTGFTTAGTSGQVFISNGTAAPSWVSPSTLVTGTSTVASYLAGGVAGAIPYQISTGTTGFTTAGTAGQLLQSNGTSAPSWVTPTPATALSGGAAGVVPYQIGTGTTGFTTAGTSGQLLISNGTAAPSWLTQPAWALTTATNTFTAPQIITSTAVSTAGTSGALVISGGLGIQKTAYALNYFDFVVAQGNINNATVTFDLTAGGLQSFTATGSTVTWAFSNWPTTGNLGMVVVAATNAGAYTQAFPTVNWLLPVGTLTTTFSTYLAGNGTRTALQSSGIDMFKFWSWDAGTTVYGQLI